MSDTPASIYAALDAIAISTHRVADPRTIPGHIRIDLDPSTWIEIDGAEAGYLILAAVEDELPQQVRTNILVVLTRAIVDTSVDLFTVFDSAFAEARQLPGWTEDQAVIRPPAYRHSGWSFQSGTFAAGDLTLYTMTRYAVYQRGNVAYLLQATGTTEDRARFGTLLDTIVYNTVFED
ncbi:hypothetical protein [Nocardia sp. NBC_01388]|uniref:hypothetical protein n=1 Tax=Nocardia sp. NBC_01388 TaxID=2903596 RepID=UPI00324DF402